MSILVSLIESTLYFEIKFCNVSRNDDLKRIEDYFKDFDTIYVTAVDKVYRRKLKTRGVNTFEMPFKPKPSGL